MEALRGVGLEVEPGEVVALVGPSGCGKTTLLNLIAGVDRPDSGTLRVAGVDLIGASQRELDRYRRRTIGYVLQFFNLLPNLSARDNVALGLLARGRPWRQALAEAEPWLAAVGLEGRGAHRPRELSGGEQQRVAFARAVAGRPALVLADEPTGELDSIAAAGVMDVVGGLNASFRTTFLIATHDERVATRAHRVMHLEDGHVVG